MLRPGAARRLSRGGELGVTRFTTDGDHLLYRGRAGKYLLVNSPEDAGRGDRVWAYDPSGNALLGRGTVVRGKLTWLP